MKALMTSLASLALTLASPAVAQEAKGQLRAGAAKIDITPKDLKGFYAVWATRYEGVHDPIFARAVVIDNGRTSAALVATDLVELGDMTSLRQRIERELGIPADHIMITASHDHGAPRAGPITPGSSAAKGRPYSPPSYVKQVDDAVVDAVRRAKAALQPAQIGVNTGRADVNINRHHYNGKSWGGPDYERPSDKTVWAVKLADMKGAPIAILMNYAVHSVVAGPTSKLVTGDLSGVAQRVVEQHYGDKAVALWTLGPAGDQNPRAMADDKTRNDGADFGYRAMEAQGMVVGVEVFHAADAITAMDSQVSIRGGQSAFTCRYIAPAPIPRSDGAPVMFPPNPDFKEEIPAPEKQTIQLSAIRINDVALAGVSGEVFTQIYWNLMKKSPLKNTIMVTMTNDRVGYIADDAAYDGPYRNGQIERGCAEGGIVDGLLGLIK
jgi:neutral ceramidase